VAEDQTFVCETCGFEARSPAGLRSHQRVHDRAEVAVSAKDPVIEPKAVSRKNEPKKYVCTKKCFHNGRLHRRGNYYYFTDDYPVDKEGNMLHFEEVDPTKPLPLPEMSGVIVNREEIPV